MAYNTDYILGVDGGGTKTVAQISDLSGKKLAISTSGSCNYKSVGVNKAIENLNSAIFDAIKNISESEKIYFISSCFGIAGNDSEEDLKVFQRIVFNKEMKNYLNPGKTIICNDTRIGLAAGSSGKNRIILICGTGFSGFLGSWFIHINDRMCVRGIEHLNYQTVTLSKNWITSDIIRSVKYSYIKFQINVLLNGFNVVTNMAILCYSK